MGFFEKLKEGMSKTRKSIAEKLNQVFVAFVRVDDDLLDELRDMYVHGAARDAQRVLAVEAALRLVERLLLGVAEGDFAGVVDALGGGLGGHVLLRQGEAFFRGKAHGVLSDGTEAGGAPGGGLARECAHSVPLRAPTG